VSDAKLLPIHALLALGLAQVSQQPVAELAHRHRRPAGPMPHQLRGRRIPQQVKRAVGQHQRGALSEETHLVHPVELSPRHRQTVGKRQFPVPILQMRLELPQFAVERERAPARRARQLQPAGVPPPRQPMQKVQVRQHQPVARRFLVPMRLGNPLNEVPIRRGEKLLLVRRAGRQFHQLPHGLLLLAGARPQQQKLNRQPVPVRLRLVRPHFADHPQGGPRHIQVGRARREDPGLEFLDHLLLARRLFDLREARQVPIRRQFARQGPLRPQEQEGHLLQPGPSLRRQQPRPPVRRRKILPRKGQFFEVILQQQPGPLRVGATGKGLQQLRPLLHRRRRVRQLPPQIRQRAVGFRQDGIVGVVFRALRSAQTGLETSSHLKHPHTGTVSSRQEKPPGSIEL